MNESRVVADIFSKLVNWALRCWLTGTDCIMFCLCAYLTSRNRHSETGCRYKEANLMANQPGNFTFNGIEGAFLSLVIIIVSQVAL